MSNKRKLKNVLKGVISPLVQFDEAQPVLINMKPGADQVDDTMYGPGAINAYVCDTCDKLTVTKHIDAGVTPMFLGCRTTENCDGMGMSLGYPNQHAIPDRIRAAAVWEWYRPETSDPVMKDKALADHVKRGGLALRHKE